MEGREICLKLTIKALLPFNSRLGPVNAMNELDFHEFSHVLTYFGNNDLNEWACVEFFYLQAFHNTISAYRITEVLKDLKLVTNTRMFFFYFVFIIQTFLISNLLTLSLA